MNINKENAYKYMNLALEIADKVCGKNSVESAETYLAIGEIYKRSGDMYNAKNNFKVANDIMKTRTDRKDIVSIIQRELSTC